MERNFETFEKKAIKFIRTNRGKLGIPCLWESVKVFPTMKKVTRIFNSNGESKQPAFINFKTKASLIPIEENDLLLKIFFDESGQGISVLRILNIDKYSNDANVEIIVRKSNIDSDYIINKEASQLTKELSDKIFNIISDILRENGR